MPPFVRHAGRPADALRPVQIERGFPSSAAGAVLIRAGNTHVLCTASLVEQVPEWRKASGAGWITAEYDMLPGATPERRPRNRSGVDGRAQEIQRLIGRSLRMAIDMRAMGPRSIYLDCDVLQADGGTRTASVTGAYVALVDAVSEGARRGWWTSGILRCAVAAVSVGVVEGAILLDLDYTEDVRATVDCNLVMTDRDEWIEAQATGERAPFTDAQLTEMMTLGRAGIRRLFALQRAALSGQPRGKTP